MDCWNEPPMLMPPIGGTRGAMLFGCPGTKTELLALMLGVNSLTVAFIVGAKL